MFKSTSLFLLLPVNKSYIHIVPTKGCGNAKGSVSGAAYAAGGKLRNEYRSRSMPDKVERSCDGESPKSNYECLNYELRM